MAALVGCRREVQHLTSKRRRKRSISKLTKAFNRRSRATKRRHSKQFAKQISNRIATTVPTPSNSNIKKDVPITENLIISCYFHKYSHSKTNKRPFIPSDIVLLIIEFMDSMHMALYLEHLCSKQSHTTLGRIYTMPHDEINMSYFAQKKLFDPSCAHCGDTDCFKFIASHRQHMDPSLGFRNNANEYECTKCHYFTVFNVKINVLKYEIRDQVVSHAETSQDTLIHYVTPFRFKKNDKFCNEMINDKQQSLCAPKHCPICYTSSVRVIGSIQQDTHCMEIFGVFRNNTNVKHNVFHCAVCDLFIHKMIETNCSYSF
eukprot:217397_1